VHEDIKEDIKERIRYILDNEVKASDVAKSIGVSQASVSNWKTRNLPALIEAYLFCRFLNKPVEWLVTGEKKQEDDQGLIAAEPVTQYQTKDKYIKEIIELLKGQSDEVKIQVLGIAKGVVATAKPKGGTGYETRTG